VLKCIGVVLATGLATLAIAESAQANSDTCRAVSQDGGRVTCTAAVSAERVEVARIRIGQQTTRAVWRLRCRTGDVGFRTFGRLGRRKVVRITAFPLNNPERCGLRATARSHAVVRVRVVLR
jgi:hypothetical protein